MVFMGKLIPPLNDLLRDIRKSAKANEPATKDELKNWYELAKRASKAADDRLFIVMTAQTKGWSFAKELDFYEQGNYVHCYLVTMISIIVLFFRRDCKRELREGCEASA